MRRQLVFLVLAVVLCAAPLLPGQTSPSEQVQVGPPPVRRAEAPSASATVEELEQKGDAFQADKNYIDAADYYRAALKKQPNLARLHNKLGISELQRQRFKEAKKEFERAIRTDHQYADAYNNLGVVFYEQKNYGKAIKQYQKAIAIRADAASYFCNMGAAYFNKKEIENAFRAYSQALQLDPDVLERTSRTGVTAQLPSPEDRAHYDYVMAKLWAKIGNTDRSLEYLKRAVEEGYKGIDDVYKDAEFAGLRKDPRFTQLMAARPPAIPE
ncbi:MAG: tetratricopeptide repeat protein [Acidobacteriia bacterium]|nr:tetratricopeptide repeat protein [Terriglobia bacterium]